MAMNTPFFEHAGNYTGHKAEPIPPVYDAQKVVETLIRLAEAPEDEVVVGRPGVLAELAHRVMPHLAEAIGAKDVQAVQTQGPVAPHTSGAVHIPVINGTGLHSD